MKSPICTYFGQKVGKQKWGKNCPQNSDHHNNIHIRGRFLKQNGAQQLAKPDQN
jgi:hypothetical protein